jgi:hypothetical protein
MNTKRFVSGSSVLLAGWLGATFLSEVPSQRYPNPKLDKQTAVSDAEKQADGTMTPADPGMPVTVSR